MRSLPEEPDIRQLAGRKVECDQQGFLLNADDWDEAIAEALAVEEGIALGDDHWAVIQYMRDYLEEHSVAPDARHVFSYLAGRKNLKKRAAREFFFELFPFGYVKQACRIAGMRQPRAWSTG
ncbi:MAG TPA: TusE/DsrC/DsvC family sulfur relay protein [Rhizobiales bacterium]|nr:TusE/DsrC/DsvC family sulfur relay protein [Hyphomicrobiales bacterium]